MKSENQSVKDLEKRFEFRTIREDEAGQAAQIEQACVPPREACSDVIIVERARSAPDLFLEAVDAETGKLAGFLNGLSTDEHAFKDEFFQNAQLYCPQGENIMLLGLAVLPQYRGQGLAGELMARYIRRERNNGRKRLILTCLEEKIAMYEKMGFRNCGLSGSSWGGKDWYDMVCIL